jgi:4-hydroxythreonine-4-phosphate dehydrogenase
VPASPIIGLTLGDAAGIGPEVVRAALASGELDCAFTYHIFGQTEGAFPGTPTVETARAAKEALEEAVRLASAGELDAVVTGPIHKARMREVGFDFPGQTEFFATRTGTENFAMCLTGGALTVALVTAHVPLREVAELLRPEEIVRVGKLLAEFLQRRHPGKTPHMAVAGLNPHAGESGLLGCEEIEIIAPAVAELRAQLEGQCEVEGPLSPDTVFMHAVEGRFDGVLCMYHDQGLIPLKLQGFDEGVNVTLGLPFPRTSPDHGTAFEIAGRGLARAHSMIAAINLACVLARGRG